MKDDIFNVVIHALLAIFGLTAKELKDNDARSLQWMKFLSGCFVASFIGVTIYFLAEAFALNPNLAFALAGLSGWIGPQVIDLIWDSIKALIPFLQKPKDKDK